MKKLLKSEKGRLLIVAAVLAVVVGINLLANLSGHMRLDITSGKVMTPSAEALTLVKAINEPVTITMIADEDTKDVWAAELIKRYAQANSKLSFTMMDPTSVQLSALSAKAGNAALAAGSIVVAGEKRAVALSASDLYSYAYDLMAYYQYGTLQYTSADFTAQNALCNALHYVTRDDMPALYVLGGHGETGWDSTLSTLCFQNSIALKTFTLDGLTAMPDDAAAVMVCSPTTALPESDVNLLLSYLKDGGDMLLMTDYMTALDGLDEITDYYGMAQLPGIVIDGDTSYVYSADYNYFLKPALVSGTLTDSLIAANQRVIMPLCGALTRSSVRRAGLNAEVLLTTSDLSYRKADLATATTLDQGDDDEAGPFVVAMSATEGDTHVVWFASSGLCTTTGESISYGANTALIKNALASMFGFADGLSIEGASLLTEPTSIPRIPALYTLIALPLLLLALGLIRHQENRDPKA